MQLTQDDLQRLAYQACQAATQAGALIARYHTREVEVIEKTESVGDTLASQVVTEVDHRSEELILQELAPTLDRYDLALLTEEREDDLGRLEKDYFWCIDPLDGTLPFIRGIPGYAVSIALVSKTGSPVIGVVYDPVTDKLYQAIKETGIRINGHPFHPSSLPKGPLKFFCDTAFAQHPDRETLICQVESAAEKMGCTGVEVIAEAGAVINACRVLENGPALYFKKPKPKPGGGSLWDFAATACLFQEAGLYARAFSGDPLPLNQKGSTFMNHCGVCYASSAELAEAIRAES